MGHARERAAAVAQDLQRYVLDGVLGGVVVVPAGPEADRERPTLGRDALECLGDPCPQDVDGTVSLGGDQDLRDWVVVEDLTQQPGDQRGLARAGRALQRVDRPDSQDVLDRAALGLVHGLGGPAAPAARRRPCRCIPDPARPGF